MFKLVKIILQWYIYFQSIVYFMLKGLDTVLGNVYN